MSEFRLAALDLDGTLVDSAPDLAHCLGRALDSAGFDPPSLAAARGWIGDGVEALVRRALTAGLGRAPDSALFETAFAAFDRCYRNRLFVASRLFPQVPETLERLRDAGLKLACVTNKREHFAKALLEQAGIAPLLDFVIGGDTCASKKPDPAPLLLAATRAGVPARAAAMIGDSINDRDAAVAAGFTFVFAAWGYAPPDDPALNRGNPVIQAFAELPQLLCA